MKINVQRELTTAECGDIAITAAEGGIGYWGQIDEYDYRRWAPDAIGGPIEVPEDFVFYVVRDMDDPIVGINVTPRLIALGVQRYLRGTDWLDVTGDPRERNGMDWPAGQTFDDMEDFSCMDSDEADVVIQLGAFGELVFG